MTDLKKVYPVEKYCINCHLCEVYCVAAHSRHTDIIKAFNDPDRPKPKIYVEEKRPVSFALQCRHCAVPMCVSGCISGAMTKNHDTGIVEYNSAKCVGCWTCIAACPFGAISRDERDGHKAVSKCDLCMEHGEPACVANCPNKALLYIDREADKA